MLGFEPPTSQWSQLMSETRIVPPGAATEPRPSRATADSPAHGNTATQRSRRGVPRWLVVSLRLGAAAVATLLVTFVFCLFAVLPPRMASQALHPLRISGTTTPARFGLAYEDVTIEGQGVALNGWYVPGQGAAAIVLVHGFASERREMLEFVPWLHRAGYDLLLYDQRGAGTSGGDGVTFGYYEAGDLDAAARYLQVRSGARHIGAVGRSAGAAAAVLAAGEGAPLDAVVADSGFADLERVAAESAARLFGPGWGQFSSILSPLILWHAEQQSGLRAAKIRPVDAVAHLSPRPVLLIHGMKDELFSYQHSETLYAAAGEPKDLWLVPDTIHAGASAKQPAEYQRRLLAFFDGALRPNAAAAAAP
jgi:alpha-beta hydrolase superfamily lysophospholipase